MASNVSLGDCLCFGWKNKFHLDEWLSFWWISISASTLKPKFSKKSAIYPSETDRQTNAIQLKANSSKSLASHPGLVRFREHFRHSTTETKFQYNQQSIPVWTIDGSVLVNLLSWLPCDWVDMHSTWATHFFSLRKIWQLLFASVKLFLTLELLSLLLGSCQRFIRKDHTYHCIVFEFLLTTHSVCYVDETHVWTSSHQNVCSISTLLTIIQYIR